MKKILLSLGSVAAVAAPIVAVVACGNNDSDKDSTTATTTAGVWTTEINGAKFEITGPKDGTNPAQLAAGKKDLNSAFDYQPTVPTQAQDATLVVKTGTGDLAGYSAAISSGTFNTSTTTLDLANVTLGETTGAHEAVTPTQGVWKAGGHQLHGVKYTITGPADGTNPADLNTQDQVDFGAHFVDYTQPDMSGNGGSLTPKPTLTGKYATYSITEDKDSHWDGRPVDNLPAINLTEDTAPDTTTAAAQQGVWTVTLAGAVVTIKGPTDGTNPANLSATGTHDISDLLTFTAHVPTGTTPATLTVKKNLSSTDYAGYTIKPTGGTFNGQNVDWSNVTLTQTVEPKPAPKPAS